MFEVVVSSLNPGKLRYTYVINRIIAPSIVGETDNIVCILKIKFDVMTEH